MNTKKTFDALQTWVDEMSAAAPRNFRFGQGTIIPFSAFARHPHGAAREWRIEIAPLRA